VGERGGARRLDRQLDRLFDRLAQGVEQANQLRSRFGQKPLRDL